MKALKHISFAHKAHKFVACLLAFCMVNLPLFALDANDASVAPNGGSANISGAANTVTVDLLSDRAVLNWTQMNATSVETLNFNGTGGFAVLNRVASAVSFDGTLNGMGGHVFVVSPGGVVIGPNASITASSFTAAGLNIDTLNFMNGIYQFVPFNGGIVGDVMNYATIEDVTEQVSLLGKVVLNEGTITLPEGGVVVMTAGDSVYLGDPDGKIIVEMTGIEDGSVTNNGDIEAPNGKIVLAAGDIYTIPLHPQLRVGEIPDGELDYTDADDKAVIDAQRVRVETGMGIVTQAGDINADGADGQVIMTAGDEVILDGTTSVVGGTVCSYAYDFGDKEATTYFNDGAEIAIGDGFAGINGNHILFDGSIDALPGAMIQVDPVTLTIADDMPAGGSALDTVYEEMVEGYSQAGFNLDLAADELITVEYMADGEISGGSGDISLRNVFDTGGIEFEESAGVRTAIHTTATTGDGGNIYMISGSGGIVAGDLYTTTPSSDKINDPGSIFLLTTNGGDIEVGSMETNRGDYSEISAISSGNLTVNGQVVSDNQIVSREDKSISFARICLVATEDIIVDAEGGSISVFSHGKYSATSDIIICAGENITITNANGGIYAFAQTSENIPDEQTSNARIDISAGGELYPDAGVITINGVVYDSTPGADNSGLPVSAEAKASGSGSPLRIDTADPAVAGDPGELLWEDTESDPGDYTLHVKLEINDNESVPPGDELSPCYECPKPPGLPPVPHIFWIMDDEATMSWSAMNFLLDILANDDNGSPLDGSVSFYTLAGGTLVPVMDGGDIVGFEYTPPVDAVFVVSNEDPTVAIYQDSFTYKAYDSEGRESLNTATVTLKVTNYLPTLASDSDSMHMSTADNPTSSSFDLSTLVTDPDGTPGTISYGIVEGQIPVADGAIDTDTNPGGLPDTLTISDDTITYSPYDGYVSPTDEPTTFGYSVTDSSIVDAQQDPVVLTEDLDVTVTNTLPSGDVVLEDAPMDAIDEELAVVSGNFTDDDDPFSIESIDPATDDTNLTFGGELGYNGSNDPYAEGDTYTYSADTDLPGYVGEDVFDVQLNDGQRTYYADGSSDEVYGSGTVSLELTNEIPGGDAYFGQVHMDSQDVTQDLEVGFGEGLTIGPDTYTGTVIGSDNYSGTLVYDGEDWTYSTDTDLPGYIGDDNDTWGEGGYVADDLFIINLSNGQFDYQFGGDNPGEGWEAWTPDGYEGPAVWRKAAFGEASVSVDITNELPTIDTTTTIEHMNEDITDQIFATDQLDGNPINELDDLTVTSNTDVGFGSLILTDNGDGTYSYTYGPADGFVGDDSFDVTVWDGQTNYVFNNDGGIESSEQVTVSGTVSMQITNILPSGSGDLGEVTSGDPIPQSGVTSPVLITDPLDAPQQDILDTLSFVPGVYTLPSGSTLEFTDTGEWIYTPAVGAPETEIFTIQVWDGQYDYQAYYDEQEFERTPVYGQGSVTVSSAPDDVIPVAPLQDLEIPELKGCPVVMDAAASELAINSDELQLLIANSLATNPNLQPCNTCEQLLSAATILKDADGQRLAALNEIFNQLAPSDAPFTPEVQANIQTAFATLSEENPQYAMAGEYVDAFANYVAAINELQVPVGDPVEFALANHDNMMTGVDNPNIAAYVAAQAPGAGL